jgi:hypothetical protein
VAPFLTVCTVLAAGALAGCCDSRVIASGGPGAPAAKTADHVVVHQPSTAIGERLAALALDNSQLGEVRGGFSTGSGLVVNFSFQEATYVNHNLVQSVVIPTVTFSPGSAIGSAATPAMAIQSVLNNGLTSAVSNLGGDGVTNIVRNAANNQLIQQMITANIGITGLSQTLQQNVASSVASRLVTANSQSR